MAPERTERASAPRAAIYARRSTAEQSASIAGQVEERRRFAESRGWLVGDVYEDTASGWKADSSRPGFDAMLAAAAAGSFKALVVWEVSRLSRQQDDNSALAVVWKLRGMGVEVHSVVDPSTGVRLADDLSLLIKSHAAKDESDLKSERVTRGKRQGVLAGVHQGAKACYGFDGGEKRPHGGRLIKFYDTDPRAAEEVRGIFRAYVHEGHSPQEIADALNARGVAPPEPGKRHRYQRREAPVWHQSTIRTLVSNPLAAGLATYKGRRIKACECAVLDAPATWAAWESCPHEWVSSVNVPPIIELDLWEQAQAVVAARARPWVGGRGNRASSSTFLLAGLLWCDECGERIGTRTDQSGKGKRHVYKCRGRRVGSCTLPLLEQAELDEAVRAHFVDQLVDTVDVTATLSRERDRLLAMRNHEAAVLREALTEAEAEHAKAAAFRKRVKADYEDGAMSPAQWAELDDDCAQRMEQASATCGQLVARLREAEGRMSTADVDALLDKINAVRRLISGKLDAEDVPQLNGQLASIFEEFRVRRDGAGVVIEPRLRAEWMPEGEWATLDFSDGQAEGVEVVSYPAELGPVLRKVDLTSGFAADKVTCSS